MLIRNEKFQRDKSRIPGYHKIFLLRSTTSQVISHLLDKREVIRTTKKELLSMLNKALELEHAAKIQYLAHAEQVDGLNAEPIIARLKEIADDEKKHEEMFREIIRTYLDGVPSIGMADTHPAGKLNKILEATVSI